MSSLPRGDTDDESACNTDTVDAIRHMAEEIGRILGAALAKVPGRPGTDESNETADTAPRQNDANASDGSGPPQVAGE